MADLLKESLVYSEGANLWVISDKPSSTWSQQLDWYLNFQISKAESFERSEISKELHAILAEEEIPKVKIPNQEGSPLLIASRKHLPNAMTVIIPFQKEEQEAWLQSIQKTWLQLGKPSLRVFLPEELAAADFVAFSDSNLSGEVTYVV